MAWDGDGGSAERTLKAIEFFLVSSRLLSGPASRREVVPDRVGFPYSYLSRVPGSPGPNITTTTPPLGLGSMAGLGSAGLVDPSAIHPMGAAGSSRFGDERGEGKQWE